MSSARYCKLDPATRTIQPDEHSPSEDTILGSPRATVATAVVVTVNVSGCSLMTVVSPGAPQAPSTSTPPVASYRVSTQYTFPAVVTVVVGEV